MAMLKTRIPVRTASNSKPKRLRVWKNENDVILEDLESEPLINKSNTRWDSLIYSFKIRIPTISDLESNDICSQSMKKAAKTEKLLTHESAVSEQTKYKTPYTPIYPNIQEILDAMIQESIMTPQLPKTKTTTTSTNYKNIYPDIQDCDEYYLLAQSTKSFNSKSVSAEKQLDPTPRTIQEKKMYLYRKNPVIKIDSNDIEGPEAMERPVSVDFDWRLSI